MGSWFPAYLSLFPKTVSLPSFRFQLKSGMHRLPRSSGLSPLQIRLLLQEGERITLGLSSNWVPSVYFDYIRIYRILKILKIPTI